jgi:hypothetical protein
MIKKFLPSIFYSFLYLATYYYIYNTGKDLFVIVLIELYIPFLIMLGLFIFLGVNKEMKKLDRHEQETIYKILIVPTLVYGFFSWGSYNFPSKYFIPCSNSLNCSTEQTLYLFIYIIIPIVFVVMMNALYLKALSAIWKNK